MLWDLIKKSLNETLPESEYGLWIKPLGCLRQDDQVLELTGPDRFFCNWIKDRYLPVISQKALELGGTGAIKVEVAEIPSLPVDNSRAGQLRLPGVSNTVPRIRSLHPAFTFDQFMVGESNILARSACNALAKGDETFGSCLFMNSTTGLGKSHLTQAVVHQVMDTAPGTKLHYLTAQQFSAEMVKGIRSNAMEQFSKKYINDCDMLLVEDVHTLTGKNKTQEELNTILDYLIKSGRRVILTSSVAPRKLKGIDEDFRSRMTSGLVTGISSPDYETRARIVRHKARRNGLDLQDDVIDYLAKQLKGDIRRTESSIIGIKAKSCLRGEAPDLAMAKEVLFGLVGGESELNGVAIRNLITNQFKVTAEELRSRSRKRSVAFPRQVGMYLTRKYTNQSLADIGSIYNRDHSTVLHAIKVITRDITRKPPVREQVELLCGKLKK